MKLTRSTFTKKRMLCLVPLLVFGALTAIHYYYVYRDYPRTWPFTPKLPPLKKFPVTTADLAFGQKQVDQMMRDRPAMAQWVKKGDVIYNWTVRQFAGESLGHRIVWKSVLPPQIPSFTIACNGGPGSTSYGYITVRDRYAAGPEKGIFIGSEQLWACVVFESFNITKWNAQYSLDKAVIAGKISRDNYSKQATQIEFFATKKTTQFYQEVWQPWAAKSGATAQPYLWFVTEPNSFEEWFKRYTDPSGYPFAYYGPVYDRLTKDKINYPAAFGHYDDRLTRDKVVFTMAANHDTSQIYIMTPDGRMGKRLTYLPCLNTYARLSPDRKKIVFSSNRSGSKSLYIMGSTGNLMEASQNTLRR